MSAFARVLSAHGYAGATIAAVANEAGIAPGLVHHHFASKEDMLLSLLKSMIDAFRARIAAYGGDDPLLAYVDGALRLDERADVMTARCWVGLFSEALRNPVLFKQMRRLIDTEITAIEQRSKYALGPRDAGAVLAFIIGALVLGAFAPQKTAGFAAPALRHFVTSRREGR